MRCSYNLALSSEASAVGVLRCRLQKHKLSLADIPAFDMAREFMLLSDEYSQKVRSGQGDRVASLMPQCGRWVAGGWQGSSREGSRAHMGRRSEREC